MNFPRIALYIGKVKNLFCFSSKSIRLLCVLIALLCHLPLPANASSSNAQGKSIIIYIPEATLLKNNTANSLTTNNNSVSLLSSTLSSNQIYDLSSSGNTNNDLYLTFVYISNQQILRTYSFGENLVEINLLDFDFNINEFIHNLALDLSTGKILYLKVYDRPLNSSKVMQNYISNYESISGNSLSNNEDTSNPPDSKIKDYSITEKAATSVSSVPLVEAMIEPIIKFSLMAGERIWDGEGSTNNWSEATNWEDDILPAIGEIAVFNNIFSTKDCDINQAVNVKGIRIESTYTGAITQNNTFGITLDSDGFSQAGGTFTGGDTAIDINNGGAFTQSGGTFTNSSAGLSVEGNLTISAGTFNSTNNSITFDGTISSTITGLTTGDVSFAKSGATANITIAANSVIDLGTDPTSTAANLNNDGMINITGDWTYNSSAGTSNNKTIDNDGTITTTGDIILDSGTSFSHNSGATLTLGGNLSLDRDITINSAAMGALNSKTITLTGSTASQLSTVDIGVNIGSLIINKTNGSATTSIANDLTIINNFTRSDGIVTNPATAKKIFVGGNVNFVTPDLSGGNNLTFEFNGTGSQTISVDAVLLSNFIVNKTTGKVFVGANLFGSGQTCTITDGTFHLNGRVFFCGSTFTITSMGILELYGNEFSSTITPNAGSKILFTGNGDGSPDTYTITSLRNSYTNLEVDSTDGNIDTFNIASDLTVSETLTVSNGTFTQGTNNVTFNGLVIGASGAYTNNSTGNFTVGASGVSNSGIITLNTNGGPCINDDANTINIQSSAPPTQRSWSGSGIFNIFDTTVTNQAGSASVSAFSSLNNGNNGTNWTISGSCAPDSNPPTVFNLTPTDDSIGVSQTSNLVVIFNEDIQIGTGNIVIKRSSDDAILETIAISDSKVTISASMVTINPSITFAEKTGIYINIDAGAVKDFAGNDFAGILDATTWNFTTVDLTAPTVSSFNPLDNATSAPANGDLSITFNEDIQKGTGLIEIKKISDNSLIESFDETSGLVTVSGTMITINPTNNLPDLTAVYINVASGAIEDTSGNDFAGITNNSTWNFTTNDITAPIISSLSPANNTTDIPVSDNLIITFDENVQKGMGLIEIKKLSDDSLIQSFDETSGLVTVSGTMVTINPTADLPSETDIYINIASGAIEDVSNNAFTGITNNSTWKFTTEDNTAPTTSSLSPANNATDIPVSDNLVITFNENVQKGMGLIEIKRLSDDSLIQSFDETSGLVTVSGTMVTIDPTSNLPDDIDIYVNIASGAITDTSSNTNAFAGITNNSTWKFTTVDLTPPTVSTFSPSNNAVDVNISSNLIITFDESIQKGMGLIEIKKLSDNSLIESFDETSGLVTVTGSMVTIDPTADLPSETDIYINIASGAIEDVLGNDFTGITNNSTWKFTTEDNTAPTTSSLSPANNATDIPVSDNLVITFNENVQKGMGLIEIKRLADDSLIQSFDETSGLVTVSGAMVTIDPTSNLPDDIDIYVNIANGAITDTSSNTNAFAGITNNSTWKFTTEDNTAPMTSSLSPTNNATDIPVGDNLVITFNENVQKGMGLIEIKRLSNDSLIQSFDETSGLVTVTGAMVTIDPTADLPSETDIYINIASGAITDTSSNTNAFAGITNNSTWKFTTEDNTAPIISTLSPIDNDAGASISANLVITFNENVQKGMGLIEIKRLSNDSLIQSFDETSGLVTVSGAMVTIDPTSNLPDNVDIYVNIASGAITDASSNSNAFTGITNNSTWNFTTNDVTAPTISTFSPSNNAVDVNVSNNLIITFDEDIQKGTGLIEIRRLSDNILIESFDETSGLVTISGSMLTINPTSDLQSETDVYVNIANGAIEDISSNAFVGITNNSTWKFTTEDITSPTSSSISPTNNATDIPVGDNLVITFNENVQKGMGLIEIKRLSDDSLIQSFDETSGLVTASGSMITINPTANLPDNLDIYVNIASGAITDTSSNTNAFAGITNNSTWKFTTEDNTAPMTSSLSPTNNATDIPVGDNLVITFDENIQKGMGLIEIKRLFDDSLIQSFDETSGLVTVSGTMVTIDPTSNLPDDIDIYVNITNGAITDTSSNTNAFAGITNNSTWKFTTVDLTSPTVSTLSPTNNAVNVAVGSNLVVVFDENVQKGIGLIEIKKLSDDSLIESFDETSGLVTISGAMVTINPTSDLPSETDIYINIANGAIEDISNNDFAGITNNSTWKFTTEDNTAPSISLLSPVDDAPGASISADLAITFNENVQKGMGLIEIKRLSDDSLIQSFDETSGLVTVSGTMITINPTANLPDNIDIYVNIASGAITDASSNTNAFTGITNNSTWNFTTTDVTAPIISTLSPTNNMVDVPVGDNLIITFDENIQKGIGLIEIKKISDNSLIESFDETSGLVTISGTMVTIDPTTDLPSETDIYVNIASGAIEDISDNDFAGITNNSTWKFTTEDNTAPLTSSLSPTNNATDIPVGDNLVITFDENVQKGMGLIEIKRLSDDSLIQSFDETSGLVTVSGNALTINPTASLPDNIDIYVNIANGAITDASSNANAFIGITNNSTWKFTTEDNTDPTISTLTPADNAINIPAGNNLVITFDENIQKGMGLIEIKKLSDDSLIESFSETSPSVTVSGTMLTINPTSDLPIEDTVYVNIANGAITDTSSNANAFTGITGNSTWNFTTVDLTSPVLSALSPNDEATDVALTSNLLITFNEAIKTGIGNISIKKVSDDSTLETIDVTTGLVTIVGNMVTVNPNLPLPSETDIYINIDGGAIQDISNNIYAGISNNSTWNFLTEDITAPTITSLTPADEETNVITTSNLVITFDENIQKGTGMIEIKLLADDSIIESFDVTSSEITTSGTMLTINPVAPLPEVENVYVNIDAGAIVDASSNMNSFTGISNNSDWNFTTSTAIPAPDVTSSTHSAVIPTGINATPTNPEAKILLTGSNVNLSFDTNNPEIASVASALSGIKTYTIIITDSASNTHSLPVTVVHNTLFRSIFVKSTAILPFIVANGDATLTLREDGVNKLETAVYIVAPVNSATAPVINKVVAIRKPSSIKLIITGDNLGGFTEGQVIRSKERKIHPDITVSLLPDNVFKARKAKVLLGGKIIIAKYKIPKKFIKGSGNINLSIITKDGHYIEDVSIPSCTGGKCGGRHRSETRIKAEVSTRKK